MNFSTPWFKTSWLKSLWLKSPGLKIGVEKSGVEMFFNPTEIFEEIVTEEENLLDNDYPEEQTESEQRGISYQMFKWIIADNTTLCKQLNLAVVHEY